MARRAENARRAARGDDSYPSNALTRCVYVAVRVQPWYCRGLWARTCRGRVVCSGGTSRELRLSECSPLGCMQRCQRALYPAQYCSARHGNCTLRVDEPHDADARASHVERRFSVNWQPIDKRGPCTSLQLWNCDCGCTGKIVYAIRATWRFVYEGRTSNEILVLPGSASQPGMKLSDDTVRAVLNVAPPTTRLSLLPSPFKERMTDCVTQPSCAAMLLLYTAAAADEDGSWRFKAKPVRTTTAVSLLQHQRLASLSLSLLHNTAPHFNITLHLTAPCLRLFVQSLLAHTFQPLLLLILVRQPL